MDGAHQCIHTHKGPCQAWHGEPDHGMNPRYKVMPTQMHEHREGLRDHVPRVDAAECIGCNLCELVCPVPDCITMKEVRSEAAAESWNDRVAAGKT